jgi:hypothetical protein
VIAKPVDARAAEIATFGLFGTSYPRADVTYIEVNDAEPAVVSLAWARGSWCPVVDAFVETVSEVAALRGEGAAQR